MLWPPATRRWALAPLGAAYAWAWIDGTIDSVALTGPALLVLAAVLVGAGAWFFHQQSQFADQPISPSTDSVVIASGDGLNSVLRKLRDAGVDEGQDTQWQLLARQLRRQRLEQVR